MCDVRSKIFSDHCRANAKKVRETMKMMKPRKIVGPNEILIEV